MSIGRGDSVPDTRYSATCQKEWSAAMNPTRLHPMAEGRLDCRPAQQRTLDWRDASRLQTIALSILLKDLVPSVPICAALSLSSLPYHYKCISINLSRSCRFTAEAILIIAAPPTHLSYPFERT